MNDVVKGTALVAGVVADAALGFGLKPWRDPARDLSRG
jgi:hypothetical protein